MMKIKSKRQKLQSASSLAKTPDFSPAIFKAYDIRGVYPTEINEKAAYLIGRGFIKFLKKKNPRVVAARDNRLSSPVLFRNLVKGMVDEGGMVIDIGLSTSPMLYWAVAYFGFDGGINVTASHNPPVFNGFKIVGKEADPIGKEAGLEEIKTLVLRGEFKEKKKKGRITKKKVLTSYVKFVKKKINLKKIKSFKICVDTANAVSGILIPPIFKETNCRIYHLFSHLDGNFPNHSPDPLTKKNLRSLQEAVVIREADFGVAFDGDGDRMFFVDEKGKIIPADIITALIASLILKEKPGEKIYYDIRSSNVVKEIIEETGGVPIAGRIGHAIIKNQMKKEKIVFGGELSGHYFHKENYFCEAPFFVLFTILKELSQRGVKLSELVHPLEKYFHSGEINFKIADKEKITHQLQEHFKNKNGRICRLDGLRIDFDDWWFLVRPSNTESVLRLVIEAKTRKLLNEKKEELIGIISGGEL